MLVPKAALREPSVASGVFIACQRGMGRAKRRLVEE